MTILLSSLCHLIVDCEHKTAPLSDDGIPSIRTPNIGRGRLILEGVNRVDEDTFVAWTRRAVPQANDLIIAREAPVGNVAIIPRNLRVCLGQRTVLVRPNPSKVLPAYLCYFLLGDYAQQRFHSSSVGSTVAHLNMRDIRNLPVPTLPPLDIQCRIAAILSSYDDLIEVNRRRVALLEGMARGLFEEWFVHFRFPGHERSAMKDDRPEGWQQLTLGELAEVRLGKMLDAAKNRGELRPYLANINVRWGSFDLSELRSMRFEPNEAEKYGLAYGDIVMCEGGEPGRCAMWKGEAPQMMLQKALHRIRSKPNVDRNYLFHYLLFMARSQRLSGLFTGSTIKHLPREKLLSLRVEVPPSQLLRRFGRFVTPIEAQIGSLQAVNRQLQEMKDLLLPRLISGDLPVSVAERELEAAA